MFKIFWIEPHGNEVEANTRTEDAAMDLASVMSLGGDATVEFEDDMGVGIWKFADGKQVSHEYVQTATDLGCGWLANWTDNGGMVITNADDCRFELGRAQVNILRRIFKKGGAA